MRIKTAPQALLFSLVALVVAGSMGCSSSTDATTVVGVYSLTTVDGKALPAPGKDATGAVIGNYTAGTLTLASGNTFTTSLNYTLTGGISGTIPSNGTYSVSGSTITFIIGASTPITATFTGGNTITVTSNTQALVFKK
jgi:hypothetical protein